MEIDNKFYKIGLKRMYDFLYEITQGVEKKDGIRQGFVTFLFRDIDDAVGNIDVLGNIPDDMAIQLLEEAINTIKTKGK